jgi:class 3 adenylate cyclase
VDAGEIRYAKRGALHIAYEVRGEGPIDVLGLGNGTTVWMDHDDEPHLRRFDERLASFSRLIRFDPSGLGLSDPVGSAPPTVETWMRDAVAVLDGAGSSRAVLFGVGDGGLVAMLLAATYPERVSALVLLHCWARLVRGDDYKCGIPRAVVDRFVDATVNPEYEGDAVDDVTLMAPTVGADVTFRLWWKLAGQRGASPATARAINDLIVASDVRSVLPTIAAPTLVLHRTDNAFIRPGHGRYLADHLADAKLVELLGRDHLAFVGETDDILGEIEEFITGSRASVAADRVLATIVFTDIVDSTKRLAESGDRRWRDLLENHYDMVGRQLHRFGGQQINTTGDGMVATFDGPARGVHCGLAICDGARQLGMAVRVGVHTGEIERRGDDIAGIAVHIAARVQSKALPGEVWVSRTVKDLVAGSGLVFGDRGEHELKGVPGAWQLLAVLPDNA